MSWQLRYEVDGETRVVTLEGERIQIGRSKDSAVQLPDYSVSRRHAVLERDGADWLVRDLRSTNGIQVNDETASRTRLRLGDRIKIGVFELDVELQREPVPSPPPVDTGFSGQPTVPEVGSLMQEPATPAQVWALPELPAESTPDVEEPALANATIVRPLASFSADYGLDGGGGAVDSSAVRKREALDHAYSSQIFGFLTRLGHLLITAETVDAVLERITEIAFEALPVDRGFILLRSESGSLDCALKRDETGVVIRPTGDVPLSRTMLEAVMRERVALLTYDALSDQRLAAQESVRLHQIRAAMCAPLWSGDRIIGVMQLDSPHQVGRFTEQDVDLLTALANYTAVAIERLENARKAAFEREVRSRLERYHSPSVIEAVLAEESTDTAGGVRGLERAQVSVLFADVVGFTAFSEQAAPEEVAALMRRFFTHAAEAIFATGGTLDKFIGDCVMAFFGAPMAQPDHALRAVDAAVRIQHAVASWERPAGETAAVPLAIRIGINSGPVVVGDIGSDRRVDYTVLGNTVNVAARLESSVASPGEVVIGAETYRQLDGQVPCTSLGDIRLKGLRREIEAFRVALDQARV